MKIAYIAISNRTLYLKTKTGEEAICQLDNYPLLKNAKEEELQDFTLSHFGIHWKKLNEDLLFKPMFQTF
jgi:hypothetical protein